VVLSVLRERDKVGNVWNDKDVFVVGWSHCQNKHESLKFCRLRIVYVHTLVQCKVNHSVTLYQSEQVSWILF